jgi:TctA family transporter
MSENNFSISGKQGRRPLWTRFVDIALRTAHILAVSILLGGEVFNIPASQLLPLQRLTVVTGVALIVSEIFHRPHWATQIRGVMVFVHAGLLGLAIFRPDLAVPCLITALVVGMAGSHMPKIIRHWSYTLRRVEE